MQKIANGADAGLCRHGVSLVVQFSSVLADEARSPAGAPINPATNTGLLSLAMIAAHYRIACDPSQIAHDLGLGQRGVGSEDLVRAAKRIGLKARILRAQTEKRLQSAPLPAILHMSDGSFAILTHRSPDGKLRIVHPATRTQSIVQTADMDQAWSGELLLVTRRFGGPGADPVTFDFNWFLPSIWRYRKPFGHLLLGSLFIQLFALVTPLFFQIVVDKVLVHKGSSTLALVAVGLLLIGLFDVLLQYLRTYALNHTTSRIDVELGARLFDHLLRLPLGYFETRAAGQTVARMRELETVRAFLTGQGLSAIIDLAFAIVAIGVMWLYSRQLTLIVLLSMPCYMLIAFLIRPTLRARINERFNRSALTQQFLVESVVGVQTLKAAAVEPILRNQWEDKLASYVKTSFDAVMLAALGQNGMQYINKATTALVLYFGALAVINGELTVGGLIAFNMIMSQATAPILRLSQLWQDFQQVQISVERLGDILNAPTESRAACLCSPSAGARKYKHIERIFSLPDGPARTLQGYLPGNSRRASPWHRRPLGLRQVHAHQTRSKALPAGRRTNTSRRHRYLSSRYGMAQAPDRRRASRKYALQPHRSREHRALRSSYAKNPGPSSCTAFRSR